MGRGRGPLRFHMLGDGTCLEVSNDAQLGATVKDAYLDEIEALDTFQGEELPDMTTVPS
jgi:hypothetical protein